MSKKDNKQTLTCETDLSKITGNTAIVKVGLLSPLHLGSGQADVNVDAEIVHDGCGLPFFPGKRFKGILYESGLEITEMAGMPFDKADLELIFGHGGRATEQAWLVIPNLYLENYEQLKEDLSYMLKKYPAAFTAQDVLESYTSLRYQTKIDIETGTAANTSLHNMRTVNSGLSFSGEITLHIPKDAGKPALYYWQLLALALRNLEACGLKRTRGFGRIHCSLEQNGKNISNCLIENALKEGGKN